MKVQRIGMGGVVCAWAVVGTTPWAFAGDLECEHCPRGEYWVYTCTSPEDDVFDSTGDEVGIYLAENCEGPVYNFVLYGPATISREQPVGGTIATEIVSMRLTNQGDSVVFVAGEGQQEGPHELNASTGEIIQLTDPEKTHLADSHFDVLFEVYFDGEYLYSRPPGLRAETEINCVPPRADYLHPAGQCVPLYESPNPQHGGEPRAWLGNANHKTRPPKPLKLPTLPHWGLIGLGTLLLGGGAVVFGRRRRAAAG